MEVGWRWGGGVEYKHEAGVLVLVFYIYMCIMTLLGGIYFIGLLVL